MADREAWYLTRPDGASRYIVHLDPQTVDVPDPAWTLHDVPYHLVAIAVGILVIIAYAAWRII